MGIGTINTVKGAIKVILEAALPSFTELAHPTDPTKESYKGASSKYAVRSLNLNEVDGATRAPYFDTSFEVTLVKAFTNSQYASNPDDIETELIGYHLDLYKAMQNSKPSDVLIVTSLAVQDAEIDDDSRIVVSKATFICKVKVTL